MKVNRILASVILGVMLLGLLGSTPATAGTGQDSGISVAATQSPSGLLSVLERLLSILGFGNLLASGPGSGSGRFLGGGSDRN